MQYYINIYQDKVAKLLNLYPEAEIVALDVKRSESMILYDKSGKPVFDKLRAKFIEMAKHPLVG